MTRLCWQPAGFSSPRRGIFILLPGTGGEHARDGISLLLAGVASASGREMFRVGAGETRRDHDGPATGGHPPQPKVTWILNDLIAGH